MAPDSSMIEKPQVEAAANEHACGSDGCGDGELDIAKVDAIVAEVGTEKHHVIAILHGLMETYRYLPQEAMERVCEITDITPSQIIGVATFYGQYRMSPVGDHMVRVCTGTACHVAGAVAVMDAFRDDLGIEGEDDTSEDRMFTVEEVACVGCCSLAPVVQVDEDIYGPVTPDGTDSVLRDVMSKSGDTPDWAAVDPDETFPDGCAEIRIALDSACIAQGADKIYYETRKRLERNGFKGQVKVKPVGWLGHSDRSPLVEIAMPDKEPIIYGRVEVRDVPDIVDRFFPSANPLHRIGGKVSKALDNLLSDDNWKPVEHQVLKRREETNAAFFGPQVRIVTEHAGKMDPLDLDEYQRLEGFAALKKCLEEMEPAAIVDEVKNSGLRGRGGGGFPTGIKWSLMAANTADNPGENYIICNGDEGDPGAFMDRMILESYPFRVIEGMMIAARATGASKGIFYVRAEYPLAVKRIVEAIDMLREAKILGDDVMGSGWSFDLEIFRGAGAFICGEETALIASIEGGRGMPTPRPPFPAQAGLWGRPTLINNVETFANISWIIRNGAEAFGKYGTEKSKGTKVFALAGKVKRGGLIEVPMGTTLRQVVHDVGGGAPENRVAKAVQIGGPSGGMIPERLFDTPIDYEGLKELGAMMGSGGLVVLDDTDCMVDMAKYFLTFATDELCGQCSIGRIGTTRLHDILIRICEGKGKKKDLDELETLGDVVKRGSLCGLCKTAPNPILTSLKYFRDEYEAHLAGRCPAGKCKDLIHYVIKDHCIGCTLCAQYCPVDAIPMTPYRLHKIIDDLCIRCDMCFQVCPEDAIHIE